VTLIPATFLAGSLLTLLLPVGILIALTVWYMMFVRRVPETGDGQEGAPRSPAPPADPAGVPDR
jgi:hypothetical protein